MRVTVSSRCTGIIKGSSLFTLRRHYQGKQSLHAAPALSSEAVSSHCAVALMQERCARNNLSTLRRHYQVKVPIFGFFAQKDVMLHLFFGRTP